MVCSEVQRRPRFGGVAVGITAKHGMSRVGDGLSGWSDYRSSVNHIQEQVPTAKRQAILHYRSRSG
jgi:hypothetical protein